MFYLFNFFCFFSQFSWQIFSLIPKLFFPRSATTRSFRSIHFFIGVLILFDISVDILIAQMYAHFAIDWKKREWETDPLRDDIFAMKTNWMLNVISGEWECARVYVVYGILNEIWISNSISIRRFVGVFFFFLLFLHFWLRIMIICIFYSCWWTLLLCFIPLSHSFETTLFFFVHFIIFFRAFDVLFFEVKKRWTNINAYLSTCDLQSHTFVAVCHCTVVTTTFSILYFTGKTEQKKVWNNKLHDDMSI